MNHGAATLAWVWESARRAGKRPAGWPAKTDVTERELVKLYRSKTFLPSMTLAKLAAVLK